MLEARARADTARGGRCPSAPAYRLEQATRDIEYIFLTYLYGICNTRAVAGKILRSYFLEPDLARGLKAASKGEYLPQSQVVRTAIRTWLVDHGYLRARPKGGMRKQR